VRRRRGIGGADEQKQKRVKKGKLANCGGGEVGGGTDGVLCELRGLVGRDFGVLVFILVFFPWSSVCVLAVRELREAGEEGGVVGEWAGIWLVSREEEMRRDWETGLCYVLVRFSGEEREEAIPAIHPITTTPKWRTHAAKSW
jgi:hypothetical protein